MPNYVSKMEKLNYEQEWFCLSSLIFSQRAQFSQCVLMYNSPTIWIYPTFWVQMYNDSIYFPHLVWDGSRVVCSLGRFSHWRKLDRPHWESRETKKLNSRSHSTFYNSRNVAWFHKVSPYKFEVLTNLLLQC